MELNEKILRFAKMVDLQLVETIGRAGIKYYKVFTDCGVEVGRIDIDCSYEQFLENVVACAVSEVDRLYNVNEENGQANKELCEDLSSIRAETEF